MANQAAGAQAAAGPLGVADATARSLVNEAARNSRSLASTHAFVTAVRHAYERLPAAARGPAVRSAFAWAKAYVTSSAFAAAYAAVRRQTRPSGAPDLPPVDEELRKKLDAERASLEESKKAVAMLPEADRRAALAAMNEAEDRLRDPAFIKVLRDDIESRRREETDALASVVTDWNADYPADPLVFTRRHLQQFLDGSADVDFSVPVTLIKAPGGGIVGFVAPIEPLRSWIQGECLMAGKEMVEAARAAAQAWILELPK